MSKDLKNYIITLILIIMYHVFAMYIIFFTKNYSFIFNITEHGYQLIGSSILVLTDTILLLYLFQLPYQSHLCKYPYTRNKEKPTVLGFLINIMLTIYLSISICGLIFSLYCVNEATKQFVFDCVYYHKVSVSTVMWLLIAFLLFALVIVSYIIYNYFNVSTLIISLKNFKVENRSAKKVRLFFRGKLITNLRLIVLFLGFFTYVRNNIVCVNIILIISLRFTDGFLVCLYILGVLISFFIMAFPSVRQYIKHSYGENALRLLGYNVIWEPAIENLYKIAKLCALYGSTYVISDIYDAA